MILWAMFIIHYLLFFVHSFSGGNIVVTNANLVLAGVFFCGILVVDAIKKELRK